MEHFTGTTPQGSVILAYGKAPKTRGFLKWIIVGFVAATALIYIGLWIFSQTCSVELPSNRLLLIALKPSVVRPKLPSTLVPDLPAPWRAAIRTDSKLPVFIGVSIDDERRPHAFALVYRHHVIVPSEAIGITNTGLTKLITDGSSHAASDHVRIQELLKLQRPLRSHDASWIIESSELVHIILDEDGPEGVVRGTWDGTTGIIALPPTDVPSVSSNEAALVVTLGKQRDEALPLVNALVRQGINLQSVNDPPSVIYLSPEQRDVRLGWEGSVSPHEQAIILGAIGISGFKPYELPDRTVVREYAPSAEFVSSVSGSLFSRDGITGIPHINEHAEGCEGALRLKLQGEPLKNLLTSWSIPRSWRDFITEIQIREQSDRAIICIQ